MNLILSAELESAILSILRQVGGIYKTPEEVVREAVFRMQQPYFTQGEAVSSSPIHSEPPQTDPRHSESAQEWIAGLRALVATLPGSGADVDDSRESIYAGRGE